MSPTSFTHHAARTDADAAPPLSSTTTLAVLLAGQGPATRRATIATALGLPTAALPIDGVRSLAGCWVDALVHAGFRGEIVLAVSSREDVGYYEAVAARVAGNASITVRIRPDTAEHRGAAGTVGDIVRERLEMGADQKAGGVLAIEASNIPPRDLDRLLALAPHGAQAVVGATVDGTPNGVFWLSASAAALTPAIGFFDLKEQLIAAVVASGGTVQAWIGSGDHGRVEDLASYLSAVRSSRGSDMSIHDEAVVEPGAVVRGDTVLCRGAIVERGALVESAVLLPGARVCADAVVARSVIPPGTHVPRGYLVVDEVFGALGGAARLGTEGSAS